MIATCSDGVGCHLYASLGQVDGEGQPLSHGDVRVLGLLEGLLQRLQLRHRERRAAAPLLLVAAVASLQDELWQDRDTQESSRRVSSEVSVRLCDEERDRECFAIF